MKILTLFFVTFSGTTFCDDNPLKVPPLVNYELSQTTPDYKYNKTNHSSEIITSAQGGFSITVQSPVSVLHKNLLLIGPDTHYLWMSSVNLTTIEPGAFDNQNITDAIRLSFNKLQVISTGTFKGLRIRDLDLTHNEITHIEEDAIVDLLNLTELSLGHNKISRFYPNSIVNTPVMTFFDISNNKMERLTEGIFGFLRQDTIRPSIVGVAHNNIAEIHPDAFPSKIHLFGLYLEDNQLETIPETIVARNKLQYLNLENNKLRTLPEKFFQQEDLSTLQILEGNSFDPDTVARLTAMKSCYSCRNETVPQYAF